MIEVQGKVKKVKTSSVNSEYNDCPTWRLGLFALK